MSTIGRGQTNLDSWLKVTKLWFTSLEEPVDGRNNNEPVRGAQDFSAGEWNFFTVLLPS